MLYEQALEIANDALAALAPHCTIAHIAGSVRREVEEVGDIEIVCLPIKTPAGPVDLFAPGGEIVIPEFTAAVQALGKVVLGKPNGRMMRLHLPEGIALDMFTPNAEDYYRIFCIRTGSKTYVRNTVAAAWVAAGWCGTEHGLRKITDCRHDGYKWKWINTAGDLPPVWEDEEEFIDWLSLPYILPNLR